MIRSDPVPAAIADALTAVCDVAAPFGRPIVFLEETGSTNDVAAQLAAGGAGHGALVVARTQTRGRGRATREWFSPPDSGLYFSLVLRPPGVATTTVPLVTLAAGVAVSDGIEKACGLSIELKWPNDLIVPARLGVPSRVRWMKLGGLLAEAASVGNIVQHIILGIGVNVREEAYPPALSTIATSLAREAGREVDAAAILAQCLVALRQRWEQLFTGQAAGVLQAWRQRSPSATGVPVAIIQDGGAMATGETCGLDDTGALCVRTDGRVVRVMSGDVQWV
ncbi:MAG: biotin--[acetyl-CoA-carboxylase] ligase [Vicinamibacterales bacterium]